uniref:Uncharacterized protein n=1 Tax=Siphoviridae sp. ctcPV5 TaxID=2827582 RepID=A0A8S5LKT3_9CAUD|nr:MAG TPA: hypothetical protein [Siphoviridae sp. ctcPV5]
MPENNILKEDKMIKADKIVLGGDTTVVTGEFIIDENDCILKIKHD